MAMHVKDIIEGERVPLGTGVMAKIYPHIARVLTVNIPLIREELPIDSLKDDLAFIRKTFSVQQTAATTSTQAPAVDPNFYYDWMNE